jgi:TetR/AcrR family transcriptional regulator, cholesterol catabolism regulator
MARTRKAASKGKPGSGRARKASVNGRGNGTEPVRQQELLLIAADLFADRGYVATTVREIADEAGILSGSLYHHFDSKESMIDAILSGFIDDTLGSYEAVVAGGQGPRETFEGLVRASLGGMVDNRSAILIYQNEARFLASQPRFSYLRDAHRKFERIWTDVLESGVRSGEFRDGIDPKLVYRLVRDTVWTAPRWYRPGASLKPERITEQYVAVLVAGVASRDPAGPVVRKKPTKAA